MQTRDLPTCPSAASVYTAEYICHVFFLGGGLGSSPLLNVRTSCVPRHHVSNNVNAFSSPYTQNTSYFGGVYRTKQHHQQACKLLHFGGMYRTKQHHQQACKLLHKQTYPPRDTTSVGVKKKPKENTELKTLNMKNITGVPGFELATYRHAHQREACTLLYTCGASFFLFLFFWFGMLPFTLH